MRAGRNPDPGGQHVTDARVGGNLIQIQGVTGNVNVHPGPMVRSAYLEQVRRIAPLDLRDRDEELAELVAFCTEPERGPYVWWRAPAWTGKSALMSWFVLHHPESVQLVSFFVTARFRGQSDRVAFTDVVLEQLAELLGQSMPVFLPEATQEAHLLWMLAEATDACQQRGQRLVLVVDGLDEDRGVTVGPDMYSIAALLPARPPTGLRVVVSGRPDPPIPADVPDDHPLRDPGIVRGLGKSVWAEVVKVDMQRELKRLLHGSRSEQRLLGLVTAAGGGLSGRDLAHLTGFSVYEVQELLRTVAGRTFTTRMGHWQPGTAPSVYVLGHEELQDAASEFLGAARLARYRNRLHKWADEYCQRGWPAETPEYLLRGYYRLLHATNDVPRIVALATDQARHDRMLDVTGGDTAALAEITDAQNVVLGLDEPDLLAMARLAIHRDDLADRNTNIPLDLPALWAALGNPTRADALAHAITDRERQAEALIGVAMAVARTGDAERAGVLAERAEAAVLDMPEPNRQAQALAVLSSVAANAGNTERAGMLAERAEAVASTITDPERRVVALIPVVAAVAWAGDAERARMLAERVQAMARDIPGPFERSKALAALMIEVGIGNTEWADIEWAEAAAQTITDPVWLAVALPTLVVMSADAGDTERARTLADRAEAAILDVEDAHQRTQALAALSIAAADARDNERARMLAERADVAALAITDPDSQAGVLNAVVRAVARTGDTEQARMLAERAEAVICDFPPFERVEALAALVAAVARGGDTERARMLAEQAEAAALDITNPDGQARALVVVVGALADAGALERAREVAERAEAAARTVTDPLRRAHELAALVLALAAAGDHGRARVAADRAEAMAAAVTDPYRHARALAALVPGVAAAGDIQRARKLAEQAAAISHIILNPFWRVGVLQAVATAVARAGDVERAEAIVRDIAIGHWEAEEWAALVAAVARGGGIERAEAMTRTATDPYSQADALAALAIAVADAGDTHRARMLAERAEAVAGDITQPYEQAAALAVIAEAMARAGDRERARMLTERAETVVRDITWPHRKAEALAAVAAALARTGDIERAEAVAGDITQPYERAAALAAIAGEVEPNRARSLIVQALSLGGWVKCLEALAQLQTTALSTLTDEYLKAASSRTVPQLTFLRDWTPFEYLDHALRWMGQSDPYVGWA
jgi:tetratricopeptide (TPR) repeat protein